MKIQPTINQNQRLVKGRLPILKVRKVNEILDDVNFN